MKKTIQLQARTPPPPPKKARFPWILLFVALFCCWFVWQSLSVELPEHDEAPRLYSNQCQQDIRLTLLSAIKQASSSIYLVMFGLTDRSMLQAISKKIEASVPTEVFYDVKGSTRIHHFLQGGQIHPIQHTSLMHQKILVLDHERVFIGSANMTDSSLRMHDNLVIGLMSRPIARFLEEHKPFEGGYFKTRVGGQEVELWLLPDPRGRSLSELRRQIKTAQKTIEIALFTFTHPGLTDDLIEAHRRGVNVKVVVDLQSGLGASSKTVDRLKKAGVPIFLSRGIQLLHHKFIYIDRHTLFTGSANWTKAAFYKNSDCVIALHHLTPAQKKFMQKLWRQIETAVK